MIDFKTNNSDYYDLEVSKAKTLKDIASLFKEILNQIPDKGNIHISLLPPVNPNISIPLAFKVIIDIYKEFSDRNISLIFYLDSDEIQDHLYKYIQNITFVQSEFIIKNTKIILKISDVIQSKTEAIVNASNTQLKLGGGVSGAIRNSANPIIQDVLYNIVSKHSIKPGEAVLTESFGIPGIKYIIHVATVAGTEDVVKIGLQNVLLLCDKYKIKSVSIPALGAGVGGLKMEFCANVFQQLIKKYLKNTEVTQIEEINFCLWTKTDYDIFNDVFKQGK